VCSSSSGLGGRILLCPCSCRACKEVSDLCLSFDCRLFGHSGACSACGQSIPASEMVMRAQGSVYHLKVSIHQIIEQIMLLRVLSSWS